MKMDPANYVFFFRFPEQYRTDSAAGGISKLPLLVSNKRKLPEGQSVTEVSDFDGKVFFLDTVCWPEALNQSVTVLGDSGRMDNYEVSIQGITEAGESFCSFRRRPVHPILDKQVQL